MAATVSHLPAFLSLFSHKNLFLVDPQHQSTLRFTVQQRRPAPPHCTLRASSFTKKTSRKVKSNAELCNELRQFLTAVGLPECHVPSLKDLSQHGRNDLANIVRRRGYKLIRELLAGSSGSSKTNINESVDGLSLDEKVLDRCQDGKVDNVADGDSSSTEVSVLEDHSSSNLEPSHNSDHHSYPALESPPNLSLEKKVEKFMQNGDLDAVEDDVYGTLIENDAEEIKGENKSGNTEEVQLIIPTSEHSKNALDGNDAIMALNWRTSISTMAVGPSLSRDDSSSAEGLSSPSDKDLDVKTSEREDQLDPSHLKFMLHQKEMELSRLKEQIEKEKLALSNLQTKAEMAISKAQKLVSEKDAELLAAEESLSELMEVEIQYWGDGEIVEVTGSFNGWHHQIKMDPHPSSSIIDPLRKPKLWSTMLWLYPGTYEIKFIVDGQWKIDPQRESVTRGTISNNILRVDR